MSRPFFNNSIAELEQMFEQRSNEPQFRKLLHEELAYRTTQRSERLKKRLIALDESTSHVSSKKIVEDKPAPTSVKEKNTTTLQAKFQTNCFQFAIKVFPQKKKKRF